MEGLGKASCGAAAKDIRVPKGLRRHIVLASKPGRLAVATRLVRLYLFRFYDPQLRLVRSFDDLDVVSCIHGTCSAARRT